MSQIKRGFSIIKKKSYKIVASDLDGTLLKNHYSITKYNQEILMKTHAKGIKIVIATGRPYQLIKKYIHELPFVNTFIVNNGAGIFQKSLNKYLAESYIPNSYIKALVKLAETENIDYEIHTHVAIYVKGDKRLEYYKLMIQKMVESQKPNIVSLPSQSLNGNVTKMMFVEPNLSKYNILKDKLKLYKNLSITQSQENYIDINMNGITKGTALKRFAEINEIKAQEILAIGDQENDISMIQYAQLGIAMGDAVKELKNIADVITETSNNNGVGKALLRYIK